MSAEPHADASDSSTVESERGSSAPFRLGPRQFRRAWIAAGLFVLGSIGVMYPSGPRGDLVFSNVVLTASAAATAVALGLLARRSESPDALGWGLTAVGTGLFAAGEFAWMCYELWLGGVPFPGASDLFYLTDYPFLAAGLLVIAASRHRLGSILRVTLDGLLVAVALLAISWQFVLEPILAGGAVGGATLWVSAAYPALDIVLAAIAFVVAAHARGPRRVPITLLAAGNVVWAFGDSAFAYLSITGRYDYSEFDMIWLAGNLIVALAALHPSAATPPLEVDRRRYAFRETVAPYAPFLLAMTVTGYAASTGTLDPVGLALGALVLLALVARQTYVFFDAAALERRREAYPEVEFVVEDTVPAVDVRAGPLLSTVFRNLLNNAVQHNDAAEPRVVIAADSGPETVTVRVSDNGPGIPSDRRDAVFGRGEKGLESEGTGIGLYLVDTLVSQYGGDVWIESSDLGGAAFVVELRRYRG